MIPLENGRGFLGNALRKVDLIRDNKTRCLALTLATLSCGFFLFHEVRGQERTEVRGQRTEVRGQRSEDGSHPSEMRPSTICRTYGVNSAVVNELHGVKRSEVRSRESGGCEEAVPLH